MDPALLIQILRPDDLLMLTLRLLNLEIDPTDGRIHKRDREQPAMLLVEFPPQHMLEAAFSEGLSTSQPPPAPPVQTLLAGPSTLAFHIPDEHLPLTFSIESLLDWRRFPIVTTSAAAAPLDEPLHEAPQLPNPAAETAIEFPYRLMLSPDSTTGWVHAVHPVTHNGRTELWHTRMGHRRVSDSETKVDAVVVDERVVGHLIASGHLDAQATASPQPFLSSMRAEDRRRIVDLTTGWPQSPDSPFEQPVPPRPISVHRFILSPLGAWANLEGRWPDNPRLVAWTHRATLGRDHYVRLTEPGFLMPFGHRASLVTVTERKVESGFAYLKQRYFVVVQEPVKRYDQQPYEHRGREMPFVQVEVRTLITPPLDLKTNSVTGEPDTDDVIEIKTIDGDSPASLNYS